MGGPFPMITNIFALLGIQYGPLMNQLGILYFMAKDTFYFSHDYNARNDSKIKRLISKHGMLGYGLWWAIVEDLYNNTNVLPTDYECISFDLRTDVNTIKSIINDFDLFVIEGETFGSTSIQKRLEERNSKSVKARESVLKRWNKDKTDTNVLPTNNGSNTIKEKKGKESKEKDNKDLYVDFSYLNLYQQNIKMLKVDYEKLCIEHTQQVSDTAIKILSDYKIEKGYKNKNDYLTILKWGIEAANKKLNKPNKPNQPLDKIQKAILVNQEYKEQFKQNYDARNQ